MWQDYVIVGVQVVLALSLIPMAFGSRPAPSLWVSIPTVVALTIFFATMYTLLLWWSASILVCTTLLWLRIVYRRAMEILNPDNRSSRWLP